MSGDDELDYVGIDADGVVTAWLSAKYATTKEVRAFYREMADSRRAVHRMSTEDARAALAAA